MSIHILTADPFEQEKTKTRKCLEDVMHFLSHDTSLTRVQLAAVLRQRAHLIETDAQFDVYIKKLSVT